LPAPVLEITDLHKKFKEIEVLKGVDLTMATGDVVSIIGSSGSGKTTMLRCVNLLEDFQQGSIRIDGEEIGYTAAPDRRRRKESEIARQRSMTGMVFQQFNLFPHKTVLDNITLAPIRVRKVPVGKAAIFIFLSTQIVTWVAAFVRNNGQNQNCCCPSQDIPSGILHFNRLILMKTRLKKIPACAWAKKPGYFIRISFPIKVNIYRNGSLNLKGSCRIMIASPVVPRS